VKKLWLTRDKDGGELSQTVEAWAIEPERVALPDGDSMWIAPLGDVDRRQSLHSTWSLPEAALRFGQELLPTSGIEAVICHVNGSI